MSARSLLDAIAKRVIYTGGIGTVSIAKIMHNSASFTFDLVMAECRTAGIKAGIDAATIVKVFNEVAFGQMMRLEVRLPATYLQKPLIGRARPLLAPERVQARLRPGAL